MRSSIRQVAERAGVSRMTVSNVLRGRKERVSPATQERVLEAVRDMDYWPVAQPSLQQSHVQTRIISVAFERENSSHHPNPLDTFVYEGLCEGAAHHGYDLLTLLRAGSDWVLDREEFRFLDRRTDGLIFISTRSDDRQTAMETLARHKVPTVVCSRRDVPEGVAWVDPDNARAVELAVEHLVGLGHRRIAFLGGTPGHYDINERQRSFCELTGALELDGAEELIVNAARLSFPSEAELDSLFSTGSTAVLCANDHAARAVWHATERRGLSVPGDLSIVGIDDSAIASDLGLTTIAISFAEVGKAAIEAWMGLRDGVDPAQCCKVIPVDLKIRQSTRAPKTAP